MVFLTNTMESCFCYKQFIFVLYSRLLCNTTEISQNEGFIISSENISSHVVTQSAFTVQHACSYCSMYDGGEQTHWWQQAFFWTVWHETVFVKHASLFLYCVISFCHIKFSSGPELGFLTTDRKVWRSSVWMLWPFHLFLWFLHTDPLLSISCSEVLMYKSMFLVFGKIWEAQP